MSSAEVGSHLKGKKRKFISVCKDENSDTSANWPETEAATATDVNRSVVCDSQGEGKRTI